MRTHRNSISWTTVLLSAALLGLTACSLDERPKPETVTVNGRVISADSYERGTLKIRVTPAVADSLEAGSAGDLTAALTAAGIERIERTFPHAGKFEERHREAGLHLWYDLYFDEEMPLTRAGGSIEGIPGIDEMEYVRKVVRTGGEILLGPMYHELTGVHMQERRSSEAGGEAVTTMEALFDDPGIGKQWHYLNKGKDRNTVAGADINVLPVWENYTTGNQEIIVAVVDGGVDYTHEDLADNMWHNPEQSGDNVYGYNFTNSSYKVTPDDHGTHVAGTVAAVNNNGIGVAGVAGGDKGRGVPGVRLMSCQIFDGDKSAGGANAIVWAADHGAVIAQNSWGYSFETHDDALNFTTPEYDKTAMDYFNNVTGGVVIFAAGNDGWSVGYPGDYEGCIAVGAIAADYEEAYYTNHGNWVDVAAPGGDVQKGPQVYSTVPGGYGYMQGTSMACPHVSGIAALLLSRYASEGKTLTSEEIRERIVNGTRDISKWCNRELGSGLVDSYLIVVGEDGEAPEPVEDLTVTGYADMAVVEFTVPEDPDDGRPWETVLYWSTETLTADNLTSADSAVYRTWEYTAGQTVRDTVATGRFSTPLNFAILTRDYGGRTSLLPQNVGWTSGENRPPVITPITDTDVEFRVFETGYIDMVIADPDGHSVEMTVKPENSPAVITARTGDTVRISIQGTSVPETDRKYTESIVVTDAYGAVTEMEYSYSVKTNEPPVVSCPVDDIMITTIEPVRLNVSDYFTDPDGEPLSMSSTVSNPGIVSVNTPNSTLVTISPIAEGSTDVTLTATDAAGASVSTTFSILVRYSETPLDMYPNPVSDTLYIRPVQETASALITVRNSTGGTAIQTEAPAGPFNPAAVDMSALPGGLYSVTVTIDGTAYTRTIAKL